MSDEYLLGESDAELSRLGFQHEVWAAPTAALWDRAGFSAKHVVADLGCGPGFAALPLARRVREGKVLAVDASKKSIVYLEHAAEALRISNIDTRNENVGALVLRDETLDGVFARWLFCFLKEPEVLVKKIAAALKPGGTVAVMDYFRYECFSLAPPVAVMETIIDAVKRDWGGGLQIGGHLPAMFCAAGLELVDVRPIVHCARPGSAKWEWPRSFFLGGYLESLVEKGQITAADSDAFATAFSEREATPGAFMLTPPVMAIVARKPM